MLDAAEVTFALPDGRVLRATRQQATEDKAKGRKSWVGTFVDEPGSIVAFSTVRGVTAGFISYGTETWEILPARAGKHVLYRVDDSKLPTAELEVSQAKADDQDLATASSDFGLGATTATSGGAWSTCRSFTPRSARPIRNAGEHDPERSRWRTSLSEQQRADAEPGGGDLVHRNRLGNSLVYLRRERRQLTV
jgi:hypothetical protein